jgi:hypothetical protein
MKFPLGRQMATPGALAAIDEAGQSPTEFLARHATGDWGDVCLSDQHANELAIADGSRIFSKYHTKLGVPLFVITEADRGGGTRTSLCGLGTGVCGARG